jgi:hypothetical protein
MSGSAAAAAALILPGCNISGDADAGDSSTDVALVESALAEELAFGVFCDQLSTTHRSLAVRLAAVSATQTAHADALNATLEDLPAPTTGSEPATGSIAAVSRRAARLHD